MNPTVATFGQNANTGAGTQGDTSSFGWRSESRTHSTVRTSRRSRKRKFMISLKQKNTID